MAAEQGDAEAQSLVGTLYLRGLGLAENEEKEAIKWFLKASKQGNESAQVTVAGYFRRNEISESELLNSMSSKELAAALEKYDLQRKLDEAEIMASKQAQAAASLATPAANNVKVSASARVTESNSTWWRYAYQVTLQNNNPTAVRVNVKIQFLDQDGFVVDDADVYDVQLNPGQARRLADYCLINAKAAPRVKNVNAEVKLR